MLVGENLFGSSWKTSVNAGLDSRLAEATTSLSSFRKELLKGVTISGVVRRRIGSYLETKQDHIRLAMILGC